MGSRLQEGGRQTFSWERASKPQEEELKALRKELTHAHQVRDILKNSCHFFRPQGKGTSSWSNIIKNFLLRDMGGSRSSYYSFLNGNLSLRGKLFYQLIEQSLRGSSIPGKFLIPRESTA